MMKRLLACLLTVACLLTAVALAEGEALNLRVIKCSERVNIREYPTTNATIVSKAPLGAIVVGQQCSRNPEWYAVVYNGIAGYIRGDFLEVVDAAAAPAVEVPAEAAPVEPAPDAASEDVDEADPAEAPVPEGEPELPEGDVPMVVDEPIVQDVPVEEPAPVEEAPVEEAPVEEAPVEEAPVEEAPVEEAPVEEAPVEEAPVEEPAPEPVVLPAVENAPIAGITDASGYENDAVVLDVDAGGAHIIARRILQEAREYLAVVALDGEGNAIWKQETATSGITELNLTDAFIGGIAARPLVMIYNAELGLGAIDVATGNLRWLLSKDDVSLGAGVVHAVVPGSGILYIGGYYGPDPVAIDANGRVLWQSDAGSDTINWLQGIELTADGLKCAYGDTDGAGTPGTVLYDYNGAVKGN